MGRTTGKHPGPPRIERLKMQNFRALQDIEIKKLTPLTVLLGPNGSGKSTVFEVFAFLAECFETGLQQAWKNRDRAQELKSREADGPVLIEISYREELGQSGPPLPMTYHLEVNEINNRPVVEHEWLGWK